jgi:predicted DNA-binding protein (UPF0251 family)
MVRSFQNAMSRRGERSRQALLHRLEGELDGIYDLICQFFPGESEALEVLEHTLRRAMTLSRKERYERYLRLWALSVTVGCIRRAFSRFESERTEEQALPFAYLSLDEKLVLFLHDRVQLSYEEIAGVAQMPVGRVGRFLTYAREKVAHQALGLHWAGEENQALRERLAWNRAVEHADSQAPTAYLVAMGASRQMILDLPARRFAEIESSVRTQKLLPILGHSDRVRWQDLSWRYKLGLEASLLGLVGMLAVVVLPWTMSRVNGNALIEGRFGDLFQVESQASVATQNEAITADRLLAANDLQELEQNRAPASDEFADMDFPSGDAYEAGVAPVAPSRQSAAVYRLIVQSPSPQELIPHVHNLFAEKNVRERESSGRVMPGGVYFDGVTSVGNYPQILREVQKLGQTKTYSNPNASRNPSERARVIVWVQQI